MFRADGCCDGGLDSWLAAGDGDDSTGPAAAADDGGGCGGGLSGDAPIELPIDCGVVGAAAAAADAGDAANHFAGADGYGGGDSGDIGAANRRLLSDDDGCSPDRPS